MTDIPPLVLKRTPDEVQEEEDTLWLERLTNQWRDSTKAAAEAALEIARNWVDGRGVGRFYPESTAFEFLSVAPVASASLRRVA